MPAGKLREEVTIVTTLNVTMNAAFDKSRSRSVFLLLYTRLTLGCFSDRFWDAELEWISSICRK